MEDTTSAPEKKPEVTPEEPQTRVTGSPEKSTDNQNLAGDNPQEITKKESPDKSEDTRAASPLQFPGEPPAACFPQNLKEGSISRLTAANYNYDRWLFDELFNKGAGKSPQLILLIDQKTREKIKVSKAESFADIRASYIVAEKRLEKEENKEEKAKMISSILGRRDTTLTLALKFHRALEAKRKTKTPILGSTLSFLSQLCGLPSQPHGSNAEAILGFQHAVHLLALGETKELRRNRKADLENLALGWKPTDDWQPDNSGLESITAAEWFEILGKDWTFEITEEAPKSGPGLAAWIACHPEWYKNVPAFV